MVPHLVTALTGPLNELEQRVLDSMSAIERWFRLEWMEHTPPLYAAVGIRNAGFKLAPVSTSLHPSAWNQLTPEMLPLAVQAAMAAIEKICPEARNLLIIPDNNIRLAQGDDVANLAQLARIFRMAGLNVRIGSIDPELKVATQLSVPGGGQLTLEPVQRQRHRVGVRHFDPCTVLMNNDLAAGAPGILEDLYAQYLLPPLHAGASVRRKSRHAQSYEELAKRFGKLIGIDHWLITPIAAQVARTEGENGLAALTAQVDAVLTKTRRKYKEYGIHEKPFAVLKADHGICGIAMLRDAKDVATLAQQSSIVGPNGQLVCDLLVQEGVVTNERINTAAAEPLVYLMDRYVVGGFYRAHAEQAEDQSLNLPDAQLVPLAFEHSNQLPQPGIKPGASAPNRFYMYGVVARLALVAASYELEASDPQRENYD